MPETIFIARFYRFVPLPHYEALKMPVYDWCVAHGIKGTILLAEEGINATIAAKQEDLEAFFAWLGTYAAGCADMEYKLSTADFVPFKRMKVRLKQEIVRLAVDALDMEARGTYVSGDAWDKLLEDPEVTVIDTRNHYEVMLGSFKGAINPKTDDFRTFPAWVQTHLDPKQHKKVAMFCTGGVRCEKSTSYLKQQGFEEVYHLEGGILSYLEETGNASGAWEGECFVFDDRVSVDDKGQPSRETFCRSCGAPVRLDGEVRPENIQGVRCADCMPAMPPRKGLPATEAVRVHAGKQNT